MSDDIKTGERIMRSPIDGTWYRVTKWRDKGDGKVQAIAKEELDEDEIGEAIEQIEGSQR